MLSFYTTPVFNLPAGPKNLAVLFPLINWSNVASYNVELRDNTDAILLRTNTYSLGCCCSDERVRIHFRNAFGVFDGANFNPPRILHDSTSEEYKKHVPYENTKLDASIERFNIRSNVVYECLTTCYGEEAMPWLMEMADSGKALMEWKGKQGQSDSYIPIRILDGKYDKKKNENEWIYHFRMQFKLSHENIVQR